MKNIESKLVYLALGFLAGGLVFTANPVVEHWPDLETRLELKQ